MTTTDLQIYDSPYDPSVQDYQSKTLSLDQLISLGLRRLELKLNVWRPAKIVEVKGNGRVTVEILLQSMYTNGKQPFTIPQIQDALVGHLRGANYYIKPPIAVGDTGMALFCDRSLDSWSVQGGTVFPNDPRTHDISDCVFVPGLYPFNDQIADDTTDLVFHNGEGEIRIQADGKFLIKNQSQELIANIKTAVEQLESGFSTLQGASTIAGGPFIPPVVSALGSVASALGEIVSNLETLLGGE